MNPLLQRFLISWAAGAAATGVVVGTAKKPHKLKRRRRKKKKGKEPEPVQIGAQALLDARAPDEPGMTVEQWAAGVKALPSRFASIFQRVPKQADDGAREPDEIRTADGEKVSTGARKKKRRRGRRKQATLWDSAKESMRQTVHEVVKEEVKDTPVGNAVDAAKRAGDKVKEGASAVKEGAGVVAEKAVKVGAQVGGKAKSLLNRILEAVEANPAPNADPEAEALAAAEEQHAHGDVTPVAPRPAGDGPLAEAPSAGSPTGEAPPEPTVESAPVESAPVESAPPVDVAEVGRKLKSGLNAVGDWLQGPGAPGYTSRRARPAQGGGDVVEARDAGAQTVAPAAAAAAAPEVGSVAVQQAGDDQPGDQERAADDQGPEHRRDEAGE
ncbi:MAG: hypothetical protein HYS27_14675 [Deltaproteobacteria bacterium]|nr:hypothetical protein [Deltaproteobacteria bacterium]